MATTSLTIGNEILSTTLHVLSEDYRDALGEQTAFLDAHERVHGKGKPVQDGGSRILCPVVLEEHSSPTRIQTGYERIDLTSRDVSKPAVYDWAHVKQPILISGEEQSINSGESAVIDMLAMRTKNVIEDMHRAWVRHIVAGSETGFEDWNTLNGVDNTGGFLEENAVGSQTNSIGGISKSTYSGKPGWQNQRYDGAGSFNNNGYNALYDMKVEIKSVKGGDDLVILASRAAFKNLKRALSAQERYFDDGKLDGGRMVEMWDGTPIDVERNMPNAGTTTTNDPLSFYMLNIRDIHCIFSPGGYFDLGDFGDVSGEYDVRAAKVTLRGQLVAKHLGSSGIAFDLETF